MSQKEQTKPEETAEESKEAPKPSAGEKKQPEKPDNALKSDSLKDLVKSMKAPKESYLDNEPAAGDFSEDEADPEQSGTKTDEREDDPNYDPFAEAEALTPDQYRQNAKFVIQFTDTLLAFSLSTFAGDENSDYYRAKEAEKRQMTEALAEGLEEMGSSFKIPWWATLAFIMVLAYGPKAMEANRRRIAKQSDEDGSINWQEVKRQQQPATSGQPTTVEMPPMKKCAHPECSKLIPENRKYCSKEHSNQHKAMTGRNLPKEKR